MKLNIVVITCSLLCLPTAAIADLEGGKLGDEAALSSVEAKQFLESDFVKSFQDATALAAGPGEAEAIAKKAISTANGMELVPALSDEKYDVILQVGHFKRLKGVTGGEGAYVNEQQIAAYVGALLYGHLKDEVKIALVPADNFGDRLKTKVFIALHTDSAPVGRQCALGPSVGYKSGGSDAVGMHGVAFATAVSLNYVVENFLQDSYTKNLQEYYDFRKVDADYYEGVLEMSELSCPQQEINLLLNAERLAKNISQSLLWTLREPAK